MQFVNLYFHNVEISSGGNLSGDSKEPKGLKGDCSMRGWGDGFDELPCALGFRVWKFRA